LAVPSPVVVSIVIVNYRSYDELTGCLTAVQSGGTRIPAQVIVVDQESDIDRAEQVKARHGAITLLRNDRNDGFAAGVNRGAGRAEGRYLLLVNPDTIVSEALARTLADWLDAHPDVAVVGPRILNADGSVQPSARRFPDITTGLGGRQSSLTRIWPRNWLSRRNLDWSRSSEPVDVDWVSGACMMIRRSAFEEVGGMDVRFFLYWEDADLCHRLRTAGYRTMYVPTVSAVHHGARGSRHAAARSLVAFHRSAFRYYWKHGGVLARTMAPVVQLALWGRLLLKLATLRRSAGTAVGHERSRT
jgi:GT2 family glycosyltransferase